MKVTRERKIYAAVVIVAVLGLVLDRTIYGSHEDLAADAQQAEAALVAPATSPATAGAVADEPSLATRLANTATEQHVADASDIQVPFKTQIAWLMPARIEQAAVISGPSVAEQFSQRHTLTAILGNSTSGTAIVDGYCIRVGRSFDGFKLIAVDRASATFEASGGTQVKLQLKAGLASNL